MKCEIVHLHATESLGGKGEKEVKLHSVLILGLGGEWST